VFWNLKYEWANCLIFRFTWSSTINFTSVKKQLKIKLLCWLVVTKLVHEPCPVHITWCTELCHSAGLQQSRVYCSHINTVRIDTLAWINLVTG
jgi:hypothetical protein